MVDIFRYTEKYINKKATPRKKTVRTSDPFSSNGRAHGITGATPPPERREILDDLGSPTVDPTEVRWWFPVG